MTAAGNFADKAEALGWTVTRKKLPGKRGVQATKGREQFTFEWTLNERTGNMVFASGEHAVSGNGGPFREEWSNLAHALRIMAEPGHLVVTEAGYVRLPFDPATTEPHVALAAVEGRELTWRNSITGTLEAAIVPWRGKHSKIQDGVLTFASFEAGATPVAGYPAGHDTRAGFRSVRLTSLVAVGDKAYKPRGAAA